MEILKTQALGSGYLSKTPTFHITIVLRDNMYGNFLFGCFKKIQMDAEKEI